VVNICLICRDRPWLTEQTLHSVRNTQVPATCTILDDASLDPTYRIIQGYAAIPHPTMQFHVERRFKTTGSAGAARNQAILASERQFGRSDMLYAGDNDCFFTPGWLETLLEAWAVAKDLGYGILGGYNHPYHLPAEGTVDRVFNGIHSIQENLALSSQSWLMEWETWDRFGPLAEEPGVRKGEDWLMTQRVKAAGLKVGKIDPPVVLNCSRTDTFGQAVPGAELIQDFPGVRVE